MHLFVCGDNEMFSFLYMFFLEKYTVKSTNNHIKCKYSLYVLFCVRK